MKASPIHAVNTLPAAQVRNLATLTPEQHAVAFGPHLRLFPDPALDIVTLIGSPTLSIFSGLPARMEAGTDQKWGSPLHRLATAWRLHRELKQRRAILRRRQGVYLRVPVNGAVRVLCYGLLVEALLIVAIASIVVAKRIY